MIAAVSTVLNEEGIIGSTIEHLLAHGVDRVYIAHGPSTDNTLRVLRAFDDRVCIVPDPEPHHYQPRWINFLANLAHDEGAEWIIPFDADEYWCPTSADTIAEALAGVDPAVQGVRAAQFHYHTLEYRNPTHNWLPKIAYRWNPQADVSNGNHGVNGVEGSPAYDVLVVREWQFMSLEHMKAKSRLRVQTIDPALSEGDGTHQRLLARMDDGELAHAWEQMATDASTYDPIPVRTL